MVTIKKPASVGKSEFWPNFLQAGVDMYDKIARALKPKVSVGTVRLPLHGAKNPHQKLLHHMAMQEMAGTNWRGEPRGFRIAPSSRKNPRTHSKRPTTRMEHLAKAAELGEAV